MYAASRRPLVHADARVTPVILDVTNEAQIQEERRRAVTLLMPSEIDTSP